MTELAVKPSLVNEAIAALSAGWMEHRVVCEIVAGEDGAPLVRSFGFGGPHRSLNLSPNGHLAQMLLFGAQVTEASDSRVVLHMLAVPGGFPVKVVYTVHKGDK